MSPVQLPASSRIRRTWCRYVPHWRPAHEKTHRTPPASRPDMRRDWGATGLRQSPLTQFMPEYPATWHDRERALPVTSVENSVNLESNEKARRYAAAHWACAFLQRIERT